MEKTCVILHIYKNKFTFEDFESLFDRFIEREWVRFPRLGVGSFYYLPSVLQMSFAAIPKRRWARRVVSRNVTWSSLCIKTSQSRPLFVYFRPFDTHNFNINWKKHRRYAWDSNPGLQDEDGSRRRSTELRRLFQVETKSWYVVMASVLCWDQIGYISKALLPHKTNLIQHFGASLISISSMFACRESCFGGIDRNGILVEESSLLEAAESASGREKGYV